MSRDSELHRSGAVRWEPRQALLLLRVSCVAMMVPALMRLPLPMISQLLAPRRATGRRPVGLDQLLACWETALRLGAPLVRPGCLTRAVTLYWFLSRNGMPVELCFGIAPEKGGATGHAWLLREGEPFLEVEDPTARFTVTYRVGPTRG